MIANEQTVAVNVIRMGQRAVDRVWHMVDHHVILGKVSRHHGATFHTMFVQCRQQSGAVKPGVGSISSSSKRRPAASQPRRIFA